MRGKPYGRMTDELIDDEDDDEQIQMTREGVSVDDDEEELDPSMDPRRRGGVNINRRPPSASGQRRLRPHARDRDVYDEDDEDF